MVLVKINSNAILVERMKSRKDAEMIWAYNALLLRLKRAGIIPKKHVLDNKVSENMKNHICNTCKMNMELVPPGCHQQNAVEVAICNFKSHFLSVLAGVANDFHKIFGTVCYRKQRSHSILFGNQMQYQQFWHMHTSADHLITTKCPSHQWDARHKSTRRPTSEGHGRTIQLMGDISSPPQNIIAHTHVMSRPPKVNAIQTQSVSNTKTWQMIPPSPTPTK